MGYLLKVRDQRKCYATASIGNVYVMCWHTKGDVKAIRDSLEDMRRFHKELGRKMALVVLVLEPAMHSPSAEMRALVAKNTNEQTPWVTASVTALLTTGLGALIMRSVMASVLMLRKHQAPTKVVGSFAEAAAFIAPHADMEGTRMDPSVLEDNLAAMAKECAPPKSA
jgi:hypothetical protein